MSNMEIVDFNLCLEWDYNTYNQECPICTNSLHEPSVESNSTIPNVRINCCKHGYHTECINKWLNTKNNCPICKSTWQSTNYINYNNQINSNATINIINNEVEGSFIQNVITRLINLRD